MLRTKDTEKLIHSLQQNEISGMDFCASYSKIMDVYLADLAQKHKLPPYISMVATGGYARKRLCPASDIDLLFLTPTSCSEEDNKAIEGILYALWDEGLKVGQGVRTPAQTYALAKEDLSTLTALLDTRLIYGDKAQHKDLRTSIEKHFSKESRKRTFTQQKLTERKSRHKKLGDTRYKLEPNIKEGKGGLRDMQTLIWICDAVYGAKTPASMVQKKILTARESRQFQKARDFLFTVRCHLHDIAGRAEERLHFDVQPELSRRLGYSERDNAKAVERFMKHYFLMIREIGALTRVVCEAIDAQYKTSWLQKKTPEGFIIDGDWIKFGADQNIEQTPADIIHFFRAAQKTGKDTHPKALRRIRQNLKLIDKDVRHNKDANKAFLDMLCAKKGAAISLRRMNETSVLEHFIPEFRQAVCLMQFDRYHTLTVDEHTIHAIDIMHKIENGDTDIPAPWGHKIFPLIENPRTLYIAMFLHDLCKGMSGDHSQLGAQLALKLAPRLGLSDEGTTLASWLVYDHLFMARMAFRRDLEDPQTLEDFLFRVDSVEKLRLITLLTMVDVMAVGPDTWTSWKDSLLRELYQRAESSLGGQNAITATKTVHWLDNLPADATDITFTKNEDNQGSNIHIYTQDRAGLFALLCGGISAAGGNIVEARINTLPDGRVVDVFTVKTSTGKPIEGEAKQKALKTSILGALDGSLDIPKALAKKTPRPSKRDMVFDIEPRIRISNDLSQNYTVVEVSGRDKTGLLYDLTSVFHAQGLAIGHAKIITIGLKAVDVFYIQDTSGEKIETKNQLLSLQKALKALFA